MGDVAGTVGEGQAVVVNLAAVNSGQGEDMRVAIQIGVLGIRV